MSKTFEQKMEELTKGSNPIHAQVAKKIETKSKRDIYDENFVARVARKLKELYHGSKTYSKKEFKPSGKRSGK